MRRRFRHPFIGLVLFVIGLGSTGSSLLAGERLDSVQVTSLPSGATVMVDGSVEGTTPLVLELSSRREHTIHLEKSGYESEAQLVRPVLTWRAIGRALANGPGLGVLQTGADLVRGRTHRLHPREVHVTMERLLQVNMQIVPRILGEVTP